MRVQEVLIENQTKRYMLLDHNGFPVFPVCFTRKRSILLFNKRDRLWNNFLYKGYRHIATKLKFWSTPRTKFWTFL
ncbi:hypothetical protein OKW24_004724 [Peribacillus simplex]|nr:hypothetical protein [Peribacillus simplex]